MSEPNTPLPSPEEASGEEGSPVVWRALALLHASFRDLEGPEGLAERTGVTVSALRRAFRRDLGGSPRGVLEVVREAQRLLPETDVRAGEVAEAVGWRQADTAARVFQSVTGQTMRDVRRAARTGE